MQSFYDPEVLAENEADWNENLAKCYFTAIESKSSVLLLLPMLLGLEI